ncbi:hypothetical protein Tco_0215747 [Tanacetum coccineum]
MTPIPDFPNPIPLNTFVPEHLLKPKEQQKSIQEFTNQLFETTSSKFLPREPTPPRDSSKGKEVDIIEEQVNELVPFQEEGAEKEKSKQELRNLFNQATLKAQAQKWNEHEAKKVKIMEEYNHQISFRADHLLIIKISYVVNSNKEATMKITRGDNPLNLISLRAKFQWVITQSKKLGLPPPSALTTFGMTADDKKRKRTEFLKEAFVTKNITVDGMHRNLIPPPRVMLI